MDFMTWLNNQQTRSDEVGWVSRLILSTEDAKDSLKPYAAGYGPLVRYASTHEGKIARSLRKASRAWVKQSSAPRIGIFWLVDGDVVEFADEARGIPVVSGFKDVSYDHATQWTQMQKLFPQFRMKEYYQVPRGRVVGVGPSGYRLFMPPELLSDQSSISRILRVFGLTRNNTEVMGDEHYVTEEGDAYDEFETLDDDDDYDPFDDDNY